jgi:haloalkane dehalogenase
MTPPDILRTDSGVEYVRTPDARFEDLTDFPYDPNYVQIDGLRMAWIDEGPRDAAPLLLLHGEPTWGYLYRRMIPVLLSAGRRVVVPDLIGFGRSDKPIDPQHYTYARHVAWMTEFVQALDLRDATLFGQDWGGLIGLRVAADQPDRFSRLVVANTVLPEGAPMSAGFMGWQEQSQGKDLDWWQTLMGRAVRSRELSAGERAGYAAPFDTEESLAGARQFPLLVPTTPDDPAVPANRAAWEVLESWTKPVLTLWCPDDRVLGEYQHVFVDRIPGASGQPHQTFSPGGHFIQDEQGEAVATAMVHWLSSLPDPS